ncbi:MFS transporter [Gulosibacter bifidus]|uniref:MFS transporter n=1 Tax=Gulosibacter bifidus TaxID=272239 RepID=A0ABW5RG95_9MICO|nr:MFS transporter [Gulosibacter bifidus]
MISSTQPESARRWPAFAVCIAAAIATVLDMVKINVAIAPIEHSLGASSSQAQLIVAGYVLAFGIVLVPAGRLGDIWRRKSMFLIGAILFTLASLGCTLAPSAELLVIGRLVQGVAAGTLMPQVIGFIQQMFQGKERGKAFGIFGASIGLGTAFGPTIGGMLIGALGEELGWRAIYGMNLPLGVAIVAFAFWFLPAQQPHARKLNLDLFGVALLATAVLLVMTPLVLTTGTSADDPARWWLAVAAVIPAVAFVLWERRYARQGKSPAVNLELFKLPSYRWGVIIGSLFFVIMPPTFFIMTQYVQMGLGHEPVIVGLITVPYALVSAAVSATAGKYTFAHAKVMVLIGIAIFTLGLAGLMLVGQFASPELTPWLMGIVLTFVGVGPGLLMPANQMRAVKDVPVTQAGVAGSMMQVGQRVGNALGIALAASTFFAAYVDRTEASARQGYVAAMCILIAAALLATLVAYIDVVGSKGNESAAASPQA